MPTDTTVKFIHSAMVGAPALSGTAGAMIALLDALLVNGFGSGTVDSVVIAGGVATVTRSAGHSFEIGTVALIAGATITGGSINGEQRVTGVTTTTYTFDATGLSNQAATGAITHKVAPLGWTKVYAGTNLAAYKSSDVAATGCLLRVDDTGTKAARVVAYEAMSDVNTGTGQYPPNSQVAGGGYWPKSSTADATARPWELAGDTRLFYVPVQFQAGSTANSLLAVFGDIISAKSPDAYSCVLHSSPTDPTASGAGTISTEFDNGDSTTMTGGATVLSRAYTGLGTPVSLRKSFSTFVGSNAGVRSGSTGGSLMAYPNYADGGLYLVPHFLSETNNLVLRGQSPGFYCAPQSIGSAQFANRDSVNGVAGLPGRTLKALNSSTGVFFFDVTGPWR